MMTKVNQPSGRENGKTRGIMVKIADNL